MKILNYFFAVAFLGFALLQFNDPDPFVWIFIYGAMVVVCLMAARGFVFKNLLLALALFYFIYLIILAPSLWTYLSVENNASLFDDVAKKQNNYIEEAREFMGLLICLALLAFNYFSRSTK